MSPSTLFQTASISKPVVAAIALRLVQSGKLDLDGDVNAKLRSWRVPENEFTRREPVTLRRLSFDATGSRLFLLTFGAEVFEIGTPKPTAVPAHGVHGLLMLVVALAATARLALPAARA